MSTKYIILVYIEPFAFVALKISLLQIVVRIKGIHSQTGQFIHFCWLIDGMGTGMDAVLIQQTDEVASGPFFCHCEDREALPLHEGNHIFGCIIALIKCIDVTGKGVLVLLDPLVHFFAEKLRRDSLK